MVVDFIITSNCDKAIEAYSKMKFHLTSDKEYQEYFLSLSRKEQREIMYNILISQADITRENIKACKSTTITGFGTFKYYEGRARASIYRDKLAVKYGYLSFRDVEDQQLREKIIAETDAMKKDTLINEHIDRVKTGKSYSKAKVYSSYHYKEVK